MSIEQIQDKPAPTSPTNPVDAISLLEELVQSACKEIQGLREQLKNLRQREHDLVEQLKAVDTG